MQMKFSGLLKNSANPRVISSLTLRIPGADATPSSNSPVQLDAVCDNSVYTETLLFYYDRLRPLPRHLSDTSCHELSLYEN